VLLDMRVRPLRTLGSHRGELRKAAVPVKLTDSTGGSDAKEDKVVSPVLVTEDELHCRGEYLPLPDELNANGVSG